MPCPKGSGFMFLIMGINNGRKKLKFTQNLLCPFCGRAAQIEIIMTYTYFMFFFIPLFRWNRRYFVTMPCCGASYELDGALGRDIEKGRKDHINPEDLNFTGTNNRAGSGSGYYYNQSTHMAGAGPISSRANMNTYRPEAEFADSYVDEDGLRRVKIKTCEACGYETSEDFQFCPKCGKEL